MRRSARSQLPAVAALLLAHLAGCGGGSGGSSEPGGGDETRPTITIGSPSAGVVVSTDTLTVTGTAQDDVAVSTVEARIDSGAWSTCSSASTWTCEIDVSSLTAGAHTLAVRATDSSGNLSDSATRSFSIEDAGAAPTFRDDFDGTAVDSAVWLVAGWVEHEGQTSPERCYVEDGTLVMKFVNASSSPDRFLSSAIETKALFGYGKWRARLKPTSLPGVINSFFTIDWADDPALRTAEEIDIEFAPAHFGVNQAPETDEGEVEYAVHESQPAVVSDGPGPRPLGFDPSDDFHVYGFNITPEKIEWLVDDTVHYTYTYATSAKQVFFTQEYTLKLNFWAAHGGNNMYWMGGPPPKDVEGTYLIDWIEFTPMEAD